MELVLVERPHVTRVETFRFAHASLLGPYEPWARVQALDAVAEVLEEAEVPRDGPAFGVYHDLPFSQREPPGWRADLGYPIPPRVRVPRGKGLRVARFPAVDVVSLRYRGDLTSFPAALRVIVEWLEEEGVEPAGPLLERFHVSNALTGEEERDVMVVLGS